MSKFEIGSLTRLAAAMALGISLTALPFAVQAAKETMAKPVDCNTAELDIEILEGAKASTLKQMLKGATMIIPVGMAISMLTGYEQNMEIAGGKYNGDIDAKIAEIKETCGIQ